MSALDKLKTKANMTENSEETITHKKVTPEEKKSAAPMSVPRKTTVQKNKQDTVGKQIPKEDKKSEKHPGGRKNTRGERGEDYKMMNIAVPIEVYEKLKEASNGNMTFYVNAVLRNSVGV